MFQIGRKLVYGFNNSNHFQITTESKTGKKKKKVKNHYIVLCLLSTDKHVYISKYIHVGPVGSRSAVKTKEIVFIIYVPKGREV